MIILKKAREKRFAKKKTFRINLGLCLFLFYKKYMNTRGCIVSFEGIDGSGKATQAQILFDTLSKKGMKTKIFSFPQYQTPTGRIIGGCYLGKPSSWEEVGVSPIGSFFPSPTTLDPKIGSMYYAIDRRAARDEILQLLEEGYVLIMDRYPESNMAHQGAKLPEEERAAFFDWCAQLEYDFLQFPRPTTTFLLALPLEVSLALREGRELDKHEMDGEFLRHSFNTYQQLLTHFNHWVAISTVDAQNQLLPRETIHAQILSHVESLLK